MSIYLLCESNKIVLLKHNNPMHYHISNTYVNDKFKYIMLTYLLNINVSRF